MKGGRWLYLLRRYLLFFAVLAFVISCSMLLFLNSVTRVTGIEFTEEYVSEAAKATALNILLLSALLTFLDAVRRYFMVVRPVRKIVQAAEQMASGARRVLGCDVAVSVTGIAGPGGEEPGKPVGAVWLGVCSPRGSRSVLFNFAGARSEVRHQAVREAVGLLRAELMEMM